MGTDAFDRRQVAREFGAVLKSARIRTRKEQCPDAHRLPRACRPGCGVEPFVSRADLVLRLRSLKYAAHRSREMQIYFSERTCKLPRLA